MDKDELKRLWDDMKNASGAQLESVVKATATALAQDPTYSTTGKAAAYVLRTEGVPKAYATLDVFFRTELGEFYEPGTEPKRAAGQGGKRHRRKTRRSRRVHKTRRHR